MLASLRKTNMEVIDQKQNTETSTP